MAIGHKPARIDTSCVSCTLHIGKRRLVVSRGIGSECILLKVIRCHDVKALDTGTLQNYWRRVTGNSRFFPSANYSCLREHCQQVIKVECQITATDKIPCGTETPSVACFETREPKLWRWSR
jgi:hypothetical protein